MASADEHLDPVPVADGRARHPETWNASGGDRRCDGQDRFEPKDAVPDGESLAWSTEHGALTSPDSSR